MGLSVCLNSFPRCEPFKGNIRCHKTLSSAFLTLVLISLFIKNVTTDMQEFEWPKCWIYSKHRENLGSWLPKCNNMYDIIYQRIFWILLLLLFYGLGALRLKKKVRNCSQYLHVSEHTHWSFVYRKVLIILFIVHFVKQKYTDMQNWPSAGPKGLLAVAVCTVLNICSYMYMV